MAVNLFLSEVAPITTTNVLLGKTCKLHAVELDNLVTQALEDAAHNAVLARVNLDAYLLLVCLAGIVNSISLDVAIFEGDALSNLLHIVSGNGSVKINMVDFLLQELRMSQLRSQVTIVGQKQHTSGVAVQTTNRIDAFLAGSLNKVHNSLALLGIVAGGDIVLRLVQQHIDLLLHLDRLIVEQHLISAQHLGTQFGNHFAVDLDDTCCDELVSLTTTADTCISQELIQTKGLVGIVVLLLILDTLLQRVLSIGIVARSVLAIAATLLTVTTTLLIATLLVATTLLITTTLLTITATLLVAATLLTILRTLAVLWALAVLGTLLVAALLTFLTIVVV